MHWHSIVQVKFFFNGRGVKQDYKQAFEYFLKAANLEDSEFYYYDVGLCYEKGFGVKQDYKKAFEYYQKAADRGHSNAEDKIIEFNLKNLNK